MLDVRLWGLGVFASSALVLGAPVGPQSCTGGTPVGSGGTGGTFQRPTCGNGVYELGEQCDGADVPPLTCLNEGGQARCHPDCRIDYSNCRQPEYFCGDGLIMVGDEYCDPGGPDIPCQNHDPDSFVGGTTNCKADCSAYDLSKCIRPVCGDGKAELSEYCDRADLRGNTCVESSEFIGYFVGGTLKCSADCRADTSSCIPAVCGNGKTEGNEQCDGAARPCSQVRSGYTRGDAKCNPDCTYDLSTCKPACGDGLLEGLEECEGANLGGKTCADVFFGLSIFGAQTNYGSGKLKCQDCGFDTSECVPKPGCYIEFRGSFFPGIPVTVCY
jgi:hypothetical protein